MQSYACSAPLLDCIHCFAIFLAVVIQLMPPNVVCLGELLCVWMSCSVTAALFPGIGVFVVSRTHRLSVQQSALKVCRDLEKQDPLADAIIPLTHQELNSKHSEHETVHIGLQDSDFQAGRPTGPQAASAGKNKAREAWRVGPGTDDGASCTQRASVHQSKSYT